MNWKQLKGIFKEDEDKIDGGLADNMTLADIANKHGRPTDHIQSQYKIGIKVEREHTDDNEKASEITRDHLWEDPDYYTKLVEMEKNKEKDAADKEEE